MHEQHQNARWVRVFIPIWSGQAISMLGSQIAQFALVWWLTSTTGSATVLAVGTLVAVLPGVVLGPIAGALVDRWNRKAVMMSSDAVSAVAAGVLAYLFWSGTVELWHIYLVMLVRSIAGTFQFPAMQASTSLMVPEDQLSRVAGANQALQGAMNIVSPPVSALLLAVLPLPGMMAIDMVTAALAILPMAFVRIPQPPRADAHVSAAASLGRDLREGLRYVLDWAGLRYVLIMSSVLNFLIAPAFTLLPLLVTRHFGGGALELSYVSSSWWVGILAGGIALGVWGGLRSRVLTSLVSLVGMGFALMVPGIAPSGLIWVAVVALFVAGALNAFCNGPLFALLQSVVAPEMQGRVFTLIGSAGSAMMPLGLAAAGPLSDRLGVQFWFVIGGAACVLMGAVALMTPSVMRLEERAARPAPAAPEGV